VTGSGLAAALTESFGSVEQRQAAFHAIGEMRGVGWVTVHHEGVPAGFRPLLVMDVWEHAFMRDYKATERGQYIEAFFRNINWRTIERRLQEPRALRLAS
jgi:Fe-Mn family superoxide dismutase